MRGWLLGSLIGAAGWVALYVGADTASAQPFTITGKVSVYGGGTTSIGASASSPGFAARTGPYLRRYCVNIDGGRLMGVLKRIDYGPAVWTGRALDITYAGVRKLRGHGGFVTDQVGRARLLPNRGHGKKMRCGPKRKRGDH